MSNTLNILSAKGHISIQDLGRFSAQHLGFSASGAADEYAFLSANKYLSNHANTPLLEIVFGQITFSVSVVCQIILTGANCQPLINNKPVLHWQVLSLNPNDIVTLQAPQKGIYTYIGITGGINAPIHLHSASSLPVALQKSVLLKNSIGSYKQAVKNKNTYLLTNEQPSIGQEKLTKIEQQQALSYYFSQQNNLTNTPYSVRFIPHRLWHQQTKKLQQSIAEQVFTVDNISNKMGYRLKSQCPITLSCSSTLSKPVALGAIQVPNDGHPIVLMKDRQTMGGYPTIGNVIQVDIPRLAQLNAHQKIHLTPITLEQAQVQLLAFHKKLNNKN